MSFNVPPWIVLALAVAMPITTSLSFHRSSFEEVTATEEGDPPIVPAGYAFSIWGFIYAGCIVFGIYQCFRGRGDEILLRDLRPWMASAFLGVSVWLILASNRLNWATVICIVWILVSLVGAFTALTQVGVLRSWGERLCVWLPLSVFTGWVTVATFANTSAALRISGWQNVLLSEATWTVIMLLAAGSIASGVIMGSGNAAYGLTVVWALVAIVVANVAEKPNLSIAIVAGSMAVVVVGTLAYRLSWVKKSALV